METPSNNVRESQFCGVRRLLSRYVGQLVNGCGDARCTETRCHTGSINIGQQPVRRLTPRAARAIAFAICSGQTPFSHCCPYYSMGRVTSMDAEAERDPSSIMQQLVDTSLVKRLFRPPLNPSLEPRTKDFVQLRYMYQKLRPLHYSSAHLPGDGFINNLALADTLSPCIEWLISNGASSARLSQWHWVDTEVISRGNAYPQVSRNVPADGKYNTWLAILDGLNHEPYLRLLQSICKLLGQRCGLERALVAMNPKRPRYLCQTISATLVSRLTAGTGSLEKVTALSIWLKRLFAQQWDAEPIVRDATCHGILEFIRALYNKMIRFSNPRIDVFVMRFITLHLSVADIAQAWVSQPSQPTANAAHILQYCFLFSTEQLYLIFRTINHLLMSQAHQLVLQARKVREKVAEVKDKDINEQQRYAETNCLLLSVSRQNMLKDTFDQLWHRRRGELRRPLRVRLGTITELQIGQDLGGVQIEFFNLLCREILHEQADMFTTEPTTGCSYFKPGSSQPLVYFRHFGVLLALAMYNGITLPITLPRVFYHFLAGSTSDGYDISMLDDGWPEISRSLRGLTDEDIEGLDFTFDLNANGMHVSVLSPRQDGTVDMTRSSSPTVLKVVNHHPDNVALKDINWPGWTFEKASDDAEEVTPANKIQYVRDKIQWHTHISVAPQVSAVLDGFGSADLFPNNTLRHLFSPGTLKAYTEGMDYLNIDQLRATTTYVGYHPQEPYIESFWRVVSKWPQSKQKQLLKFVTAAERIPISGPSQLVFAVKRADNPELLPTSHTCFGTLDLPEYESSEIMAEKLSLALRYGSEGFGMG